MSKKLLVVKVTQEDIDNGTRWDESKCPVALALNHIGFPKARVCSDYWIQSNEHPHRYLYNPLSYRARKFIQDFDMDKPVEPSTFHLEFE